MLPHTIEHYRRNIPGCNITIYDNISTDSSVDIAKSLGCDVVQWTKGDYIDALAYRDIKNNCWKSVKDGWVIMADMDEWIQVTTADLMAEEAAGATVLRVKGYEVLPESQTLDLSDVDLHGCNRGVYNHWMNKNVCFLRQKIREMNYNGGAHSCHVTGWPQLTEKTYFLKHMNQLGLEWSLKKNRDRFARAAMMHARGISKHYIGDDDKKREEYLALVATAETVDFSPCVLPE